MPTSTQSRAEHPTLFDLHPAGSEPPVADRVITPGCLLPVPDNQTVDVNRIISILGTNKHLVLYLLNNDHIKTPYRLSSTMRWKIPYTSVVAYCDELRVRYSIRDRRPKLAPGRRHRDTDLLPFPLADTLSVKEVMCGLDISNSAALNLIEEGNFEAYQLYGKSPWRISKISLFQYRDRIRQEFASTRGGASASTRPLRRKAGAPAPDGRER